MFGIGTTELVLIGLIVLLLFGTTRLPKALGGLGKGIKEFRKGLKGEGAPEEDEGVVAESPVVTELRMAIGKNVRFSSDGTMEIGFGVEGGRLVDVNSSWVVLDTAEGREKIPIVSVKKLVNRG